MHQFPLELDVAMTHACVCMCVVYLFDVVYDCGDGCDCDRSCDLHCNACNARPYDRDDWPTGNNPPRGVLAWLLRQLMQDIKLIEKRGGSC